VRKRGTRHTKIHKEKRNRKESQREGGIRKSEKEREERVIRHK
jgi:hypothetical protein